ncbi:mitochondrial carrier protein [Colletotrichum paranaense]|uniref:Mitochondrial carrier protein n=1 Tax=Colletotrichum paranaense TaxID=1914294 RepID=A0ABQ9S2T1_9PEZI|nr:mitochondrial carrier protein [Colletotrichum paranaense]KAK1522918.1 mitochondrial carrier protein [Colletotrichum paranaense]
MIARYIMTAFRTRRGNGATSDDDTRRQTRARLPTFTEIRSDQIIAHTMEQSGVLTKIVAGGVAGVSETLVTYPAEYVKTRRQLHFKSTTNATTSRPNPPPSSLSIIRDTIRTSGVRGIYSGVQALAASNAAKSGIRFLAFETTRSKLDALSGSEPQASGPGRKPRAAWINVVSGLSAGVAESVAVVTPGEAIKTKMIHAAATSSSSSSSSAKNRFANRGLISAVRILLCEEGIRGLWSGLTPVLCKQGTNSAVRFTTFAMLQERVAARWPQLEGGVGSTLVLGGVSGVFTVYASMPFDNIKTRMQSVQSADVRYAGMVDCAARILRSDGVFAFWRGTSPRLVRLTLSSGITFTVYDQVARLMKSAQTDRKASDLQRL